MNGLHTAPVQKPSAGRMIGKYPLIRKLGEGGMSSVYLARHPLLDRQLIIKQLKNVNGDQAVKRFEREARIMLDLRHENIVQVHDYFHEHGASYIVMEYVDGVSLDKLLEGGKPLDETAALLLIRETARALQYAHQRGIVHRDIKPGNILISRSGEVKLTDFGIASSRSEAEAGLTVSGMTLGTPAYMSPEQLSSSHSVDRRADCYSLGITLYEAVCGTQPFPSQFCPETISAIQQGRYIHPRKVNPALSRRTARLIRRMIHRKPQRRFTDLSKPVKKLDRLGSPENSAGILRQALFEINPPPEEVRDNSTPGGEQSPEHPTGAATAVPESGNRRRLQRTCRRLGVILPILAAAGVIGQTLYNRDIQQKNSTGNLKITVHADGRILGKLPEQLFLDARLTPGVSSAGAQTVPVRLRRVSAEKSVLYRFESKKLRLKAGNYRLQLHLENQLREYRFFLAPQRIQQLHPERAGGRNFSIQLTAPERRPVQLSSSVTALSGDRPVEEAVIEVWQHGWQEWKKLQSSPEGTTLLTSGRWYNFRIRAAGFYPAFVTLYAKHFQQQLHLNAELIPLPAYLKIHATEPVQLLINNMDRWLEGGPRPQLRTLPAVSTKPALLTMLPGEYYITLLRGNLQQTVKLNLKSGKILQLTASVDPAAGSIHLQHNQEDSN